MGSFPKTIQPKLLLMGALIALAAAGCASQAISLHKTSALESADGRWSTSCQVDSTSKHSQLTKIEIHGGKLTQTAFFFDDDQCAHPLFHILRRGELEATSSEVRLTLRSAELTPQGDTANTFNESAQCGDHDWQPGLSKSILGKTCAGESLGSAGSQGSVAIAAQDGRLSFDGQNLSKI